jgi:hypothetical protein
MKPKTKSRLIFWSRMTAWVGTGCVAPIAVFATKFGLFTQSGYTTTTDELGNVTSVTPVALNGWGIVSCFIVFWTLIQVLKEVRQAYSGYSMTKQCIDGFINSVMPLIIIFAVCYFLNGVLDQVIYCLGIIIISRTASVPINPLPKWKYTVKGVEDYADPLTHLITTLTKNIKKGGGE